MFEWVGEWIGEAIASAGSCVCVKLLLPLHMSLASARLLQSPLPMSLKSLNKQSHLSSSCSFS